MERGDVRDGQRTDVRKEQCTCDRVAPRRRRAQTRDLHIDVEIALRLLGRREVTGPRLSGMSLLVVGLPRPPRRTLSRAPV